MALSEYYTGTKEAPRVEHKDRGINPIESTCFSLIQNTLSTLKERQFGGYDCQFVSEILASVLDRCRPLMAAQPSPIDYFIRELQAYEGWGGYYRKQEVVDVLVALYDEAADTLEDMPAADISVL